VEHSCSMPIYVSKLSSFFFPQCGLCYQCEGSRTLSSIAQLQLLLSVYRVPMVSSILNVDCRWCREPFRQYFSCLVVLTSIPIAIYPVYVLMLRVIHKQSWVLSLRFFHYGGFPSHMRCSLLPWSFRPVLRNHFFVHVCRAMMFPTYEPG
jgi:hypothetical protein